MSDALHRTLVQSRDRLERGIDEAEEELRAVRDRCAALEGEIRSLRIQQRDLMAAREPEILTVPRPDQPAPPPDRRPDPLPVENVVVIPEALPEPAVTTEAAVTDPDEDLEIPTSYMPMLEELWEIARRDDPT